LLNPEKIMTDSKRALDNFRFPFVSGGAGFIGSHLVRRLLSMSQVERVTIYDNFSSGKDYYLEGLTSDGRLSVVRADLKHLDEVKSAMVGADIVFHLAANPDIAKAVSQPDIDFWEGTFLAQNVLEAIRVNGVREMIYMSGSGVYGENPHVSFAESYGPCVPISTYGASKLACEALVSAYCHMFGLRARAFRFANVVGPRQTHGVGYDFLRRLRQDSSELRILGNGRQSKSYIHVNDVLNAIFLAQRSGDHPYDIFNVATGDYITVTEIADMAVNLLGIKKESIRYNYTGGDRGWKGDVPIVRFNCEKITSLGWKCERSSAEAIRASLRAMLEESAP
jgi:UDP-glucose 4-epimerase